AAKSKTGVRGLMQITHDTGTEFGLGEEEFYDPYRQIVTAAKILVSRINKAGGDLEEGLAHYGDPAVKDYAKRVLGERSKVLGIETQADFVGPPAPVETIEDPAGQERVANANKEIDAITLRNEKSLAALEIEKEELDQIKQRIALVHQAGRVVLNFGQDFAAAIASVIQNFVTGSG